MSAITEQRAVTYHKTAIAVGTDAEIAIIKALYTNNPQIPLLNDDGAMIPVRLTLGIIQSVYRIEPAITLMSGFNAFEALLEAMSAESVAWLILDTKNSVPTH